MTEEVKKFTFEELISHLPCPPEKLFNYLSTGRLRAQRQGDHYVITKTDYVNFCENLFEHQWNNPFETVEWQDISAFWDNPGKSDKMTFVDMMCNLGGFSKGLEWAGLEGLGGVCKYASERKTYERNCAPFDRHSQEKGEGDEYERTTYESICKRLHGRTLSVLAGRGLEGEVFTEEMSPSHRLFLEILNQLKPEFVVWQAPKYKSRYVKFDVNYFLRNFFASRGYEMSMTTLRSSDYGVPVISDSIVFIGNRKGLKNLYPKPLLQPTQYKTVKDAIGDLTNRADDPAFNHVRTKHSPDTQRELLRLAQGMFLNDYTKRLSWNETPVTFKCKWIHPEEPRVLTMREYARLYSFPDDFIFTKMKQTKLLPKIHNATPPLLTADARQII